MDLPCRSTKGGMANILFKCPNTGMHVEHWLAEPSAEEEKRCTYEGATCPACTRIHFINRSTGELLGERRPGSPAGGPGKLVFKSGTASSEAPRRLA
jgi:hypothetical protein